VRGVSDQRADGVRLVVSLYREFEQVARRGDLSMTQYRTLLYLMSGARRAGELAAANAVSRPTVSAMIGGLREEGWVEEQVDPDDGRVTKIVLTKAGRERVRRFEADLAKRLEALLPGVDRAEMRATFSDLYRAHSVTRQDRLANVFGGLKEA
jgi:DNA-binding MarR family transcriptional regulator